MKSINEGANRKTYNLDRLYNKDLKREFLESTIEEQNTRITAYYELLKASKKETREKKDLYEFDEFDIKELLKTMRYSSVGSINRSLSIMNSYVQWVTDENKRTDGFKFNNVESFLSTEKDLTKYVSNKQLSNKILNEERFEDLINILVNPLDRGLLLCFYNFIIGEDLYAVRSLRKKDLIVNENIAMVQDAEGEERYPVKVSEELMKELKLSSVVDKYRRNDGEEWVVGVGSAPYKLISESEYIFRPLLRGQNNDQMYTASGLHNKLRTLKKETGYGYITPTSIRDTRIVHEVIKEIKKQGLKTPTDRVYSDVRQRMINEFNVKLSNMQIHSIRKKVKQLLSIVDYE